MGPLNIDPRSDFSPEEILRFWHDAGPTHWFTRDDVFDNALRTRFLELWQLAATGQLASWEATNDGLLALIIVLDQFPRNMFRDDARAFSSDTLARDIVRRTIEHGRDLQIDRDLRAFLYMPLMHSEEFADQKTCVELFRRLGDAENLKYAEIHADIIRRFGRFPHRNRVLGRHTTPDEQSFLESGGFSG
jgi:uncharacterized protein (DUF924 family)